MACERCGLNVPTQTVELKKNGKQRTKLCADCIKEVIRPNSSFQVKQQ